MSPLRLNPVTMENPYDLPGGVWLKGNLHCHTSVSDGHCSPQEVIDDYKALGYDFLMLSDHDKVADLAGLDSRGMVLIPGSEVSDRGPHMLSIGSAERVEPVADRQEAIEAIQAAGGIAVMNHPNWEAEYSHCPLSKLMSLQGYAGIEIFNGVCELLPGSAYAVNEWDRLLSCGRRAWGLATDDAHAPGQMGFGWVVALVAERTPAAVLDALAHGRFYASTGVAIDSIEVDGSTLRVAAAGAQRMAVYADLTKKVAVTEGGEIEFDAATVKHTYVRVECLGAGGRCAWTQPFFITGGMCEALGRLLDERPALEVVRVAKLPRFGAAIDRGAWAETLPSRPFLSLATGEEARAQTDVRALTDGRSLMLAVLCDEPRMDAVRARVREQGDPSAWTDDSVQILLDAEGKAAWLWQLTVNSLGVLHSYRTDGPGELRRCRTWAGAFPGGWRVDVRIPLADLGVPRALATCRFNIGRNRYAESEISTWKWVGDAFRTPRHYGLLRVKG